MCIYILGPSGWRENRPAFSEMRCPAFALHRGVQYLRPGPGAGREPAKPPSRQAALPACQHLAPLHNPIHSPPDRQAHLGRHMSERQHSRSLLCVSSPCATDPKTRKVAEGADHDGLWEIEYPGLMQMEKAAFDPIRVLVVTSQEQHRPSPAASADCHVRRWPARQSTHLQIPVGLP